MITGVHAIVFSSQAGQLREFFTGVLGLESVDAGGGWPIFALPPAELAIHPGGDTRYELYLMCDDIHATLAGLRAKGVAVTGDVTDQGWGQLAAIGLPDGSSLHIYQPRHPSPRQRLPARWRPGSRAAPGAAGRYAFGVPWVIRVPSRVTDCWYRRQWQDATHCWRRGRGLPGAGPPQLSECSLGGPVITSVVVSYQVRPEAVAEHVRLIEAIFAQLHAEQPGNVEYKVVRLADGVSFVHLSSADTPDGSNPLPALSAFQEFGRDSAARTATPPVPAAAAIIGSYVPPAGLTSVPPAQSGAAS